jgi:hypothetical protein
MLEFLHATASGVVANAVWAFLVLAITAILVAGQEKKKAYCCPVIK